MAFISFEDFLKLTPAEINFLKPVEILGFSGTGIIPKIYNASEEEKDKAIEKFLELVSNSNITEIVCKGFYALINEGLQGSLFTPTRMNKIFDTFKKSNLLSKITLHIIDDSFEASFKEFCAMVHESESLKEIDLQVIITKNKKPFFEYLDKNNIDLFINSFEGIEAFKLDLGCTLDGWRLSNEQSINFGNALKKCKKLDLSENGFFNYRRFDDVLARLNIQHDERVSNLIAILERLPDLKSFSLFSRNKLGYLSDNEFSRLISVLSKKLEKCEELFLNGDTLFDLSSKKIEILFKMLESLAPKYLNLSGLYLNSNLNRLYDNDSNNEAVDFKKLGIFLGASPQLRVVDLSNVMKLSDKQFSFLMEGLDKSKTIFEVKLNAWDLTEEQRKKIFDLCKRNRGEYESLVMEGSLALLEQTVDGTKNLPLPLRLKILEMAFPDYPKHLLVEMTEEGKGFSKALQMRYDRAQGETQKNSSEKLKEGSNNNNNNNDNKGKKI